MTEVHFVLPSTTNSAAMQLQMIAMQGAVAVLVANVEKGYLNPIEHEKIKDYVKLVKDALLEGTDGVAIKPSASAG